MAKYYKFSGSTPYCGTDFEEVIAYENDPTEEELLEDAADLGDQNGESYEYLIFGWCCDPVEDGDMTQEEYDQEVDDYYAECRANTTFEEISESEFKNLMGMD